MGYSTGERTRNPITRKRIIMRCGSIEAFLANPSLLRENDVTPDFSWMRTVTDAEAQVSKERLLAWAESDKQASGGALGEWVYGRQPISQNDGRLSSADEIDKLQSDSLNGWGKFKLLQMNVPLSRNIESGILCYR